jgi:putative Mg2+ transporter-C (MgtC) family protein
MDTITFHAFCANAGAAALMGTAIGIERQCGQHPAGLRTNALVAFGGCLFVSVPQLLGGAPTASHLAGQLATGVGFLGGGVILREGVNVKGLNTAATLWCSAAVGALAGGGLLLEALIGTLGVLILHLSLRPVGDWITRRLRRAKNVETIYRLRVVARAGQDATVRVMLCRFFQERPTMTIQGVATQDAGVPGEVVVTADIHSEQRDERTIEEAMAVLSNDTSVISVGWEKSALV